MASIGYPLAGSWATDATEIGALVVSEAATAAQQLQNTLTIQAVLNRGGNYQITTPGTYLFNVASAPLTLPSNTSLYVGAGVTLKVAPGSPSALLTNSAARSTGVVQLAANVTFVTAPDGLNFAAFCTSMTAANAARFPVNSWVSVVVLGHGALGVQGTAWGGRGYRGVWRVVEQTINGNSSSIKYLIDNIYPGSAPSNNNLTMYPANENIKVWGPGTIDGNGANASQSFLLGDPRGCPMWWRHAYNVIVDGLYFLRGTTWTIGSNYLRNYIVRSITCELRATPNFSTTDLIHLSGNHQNVLLQDIDGGVGDNPIGLTIDCTEGTAFDFPFQNPGDMTDITIRNVCVNAYSEDGAFGIVGIYGPAAYWYRNIVIDGVYGQGSSAVQFANYGATNQFKLSIERIRISNVRAYTPSGSVSFVSSSVYEIGEMTMEYVASMQEGLRCLAVGLTATGNVRSMTLRNLSYFPIDNVTFTRTSNMAAFGGLNINALNISGTEVLVQAVNVRAFEADGTGNIPKVGIQNCSATGSGSGAGLAALWGDTGSGTAAAPVYNNCTSNGTPL